LRDLRLGRKFNYGTTHLNSTEFLVRASEIIDVGRFFHERGWVPATSGNFSARLSDGNIAITVSGRHKGRLSLDDVMLVDAEGGSLDERRPSAETVLHAQIYKRFPEVGAVLHPHSPGATVLSKLATEAVVLAEYELLKAFPGIDTHDTRITVPVFPNDQNMPRLALNVARYLDAQEGRSGVVGYILAGHGFYTWGATVADALRHAEALEFLFECELRLYGART
jgi:methylthioribulose-1-phosphate dehydratase